MSVRWVPRALGNPVGNDNALNTVSLVYKRSQQINNCCGSVGARDFCPSATKVTTRIALSSAEGEWSRRKRRFSRREVDGRSQSCVRKR